MKIKLFRYSDNGESTLGLFFIDGKFYCYCIEDTFRDVKVNGKTRIPAGTYNVGWINQETPKTLQYRKKYDWFKNHIEIKNVPKYTGVYIHIGNVSENTEGCLLLGNTANNNNLGQGFIGDSVSIFKNFYLMMKPHLDNEEDVRITIEDEEIRKLS